LRNSLPVGSRKDFQAGVTFGLYGVLSSMTHKAEAFQIPLQQVGLDTVNAETELTRK